MNEAVEWVRYIVCEIGFVDIHGHIDALADVYRGRRKWCFQIATASLTSWSAISLDIEPRVPVSIFKSILGS